MILNPMECGAIGLRRTAIWAIHSKSGTRAAMKAPQRKRQCHSRVPLFDITPFIAWQRRHGGRLENARETFNILGRGRALDD